MTGTSSIMGDRQPHPQGVEKNEIGQECERKPGKTARNAMHIGEAQPGRSPSKPGMGTITAATDIDPKGRMRWKDAVLSWRLLIGDGKTELQEVSPENLVLAKSESASGRVTLLWQREDGLSIFVEWKEVGDEWEGKISYSGVPEGIYVEQVIFPEAQIPFQESGRILLPRFQGWIVSWEFLRQYGLRRFFGTMQFCAVLQGEKSYYFACHDPKHCSKEYEYNISGAGDDSVLTLKYIHHLPLSKEFAPSGKLPYSVAFRTFSGDGRAARIYRMGDTAKMVSLRKSEKESAPGIESMGMEPHGCKYCHATSGKNSGGPRPACGGSSDLLAGQVQYA